MFKKILIIIVSTLLLLSGAYFSIKLYTRYSIGYTTVYVASHNISQRTKISLLDLKAIEVPKDYLADEVYLDANDILDKYVKLSYSIPKGSLFYKSALESDIKDLANTLLLDNEVNYDIYTNDVKINTANLNTNMYVDLYLTIDDKNKPISDLLLMNARVTGLYDDNARLIADYDKDSRIAIISLAINKDFVNVINKAQLLGKINFVISNQAYQTNKTSSLNSGSILFQYFE